MWDGSDVWSWSNFSRRSLGTVWLAPPAANNPSTIFCALQFRWTGSPCPHLSWHLCKIMWWGVQLCFEAAVHQKWLWQVWSFFFVFCCSVYKTTAGNTLYRHSAIGYILYWKHNLIPHTVWVFVMCQRSAVGVLRCLIPSIQVILHFTAFYTEFSK